MKKQDTTLEEALAAMRAKCLDCCGGCRAVVEGCTTKTCSLWPYRMGKTPAPSDRVQALPGQLSMFDTPTSHKTTKRKKAKP